MIGALPTTNNGIVAESQTKVAMLKKINELVGKVNELTQKVADLEQRP